MSCGVGQRLSGVLIRGELAIGAQLRAAKLHMRVVGVKRAWGQPSSFFFKLRSTAHRCRPVELWATHCVVQAQRQIHRVAGPVHRRWPEVTVSCRCVAIRGSSPFISTAALMPAEPHIRSPFPKRLAPQSLILEVIGLGRAGPPCMSAYHSHCLGRSARPDPTRLIRPRGTRANGYGLAECLSLPS